MPAWLPEGLAIEGDFVGIQNFVLRPVSGVGGAARRLRGRSLRVAALTQLIACYVGDAFADVDARLFYQAGGRFLIVATSCKNSAERLRAIQKELDAWITSAFAGEIIFHLACTSFSDGRIPSQELRESMLQRRCRPLEGALLESAGWKSDVFFRSPVPQNAFRCRGCTKTSDEMGDDPDQRELCVECAADTEIGRVLAQVTSPALALQPQGLIQFLQSRYDVQESQSAGNTLPIPVVHWMPKEWDRALSFEEISAHAIGGREWLGYLRIDADRIGAAFRGLNGNAARVWGLSRLLQQFFCDTVQALIASHFPFIYPVYGGGDDLFVIAPWDQALDFSSELSSRFAEATGSQLTFSAGIALAKPRAHILSKSEESERLLGQAKTGRDRLCALGASIPWAIVPGLIKDAKRLAAWQAEGLLKSSFIQNVLELHHGWQKVGGERHKPFLHYQIERNLGERKQSEVRLWARQHFLSPGDMWSFAAFLMRYIILARKHEREKEEAQRA